jgi:hypothetical protein
MTMCEAALRLTTKTSGQFRGYVEEHEWDLKRHGRQTHWGWCLANLTRSTPKTPAACCTSCRA